MTQHQLASLHAVDSSTSIPSDLDGISPHKLPRLPAIARSKVTSTSPQTHQRSTSIAYHAAVWGSPYATPSPAQSPISNPVRRTLSFQELSPSALRRPPDNVLTTKQSSLSNSRYTARERRKRAETIQLADTSGKLDWLSDFTDGGTGADKQNTNRQLPKTLQRASHKLQESAATANQEIFRVTMEDGSRRDKRRPSLARGGSVTSRPGTSGGSPTRPRLGTFESFQRPKRRVLWKGKNCIIALPLDDAQRFEQQPLLSPTDVRDRLRKWEAEGYNTRGFVLDDSSPTLSSQREGQSRTLYPDPSEIARERSERMFNISIPNQAEWDSWVEYIKEEKLRALGVTSSNSDAPTSTRSPLSTSLSRASSQYPSMPMSPDNGPFGFAGPSSQVSSNLFGPPSARSPGTAPSPMPGASPVHGTYNSEKTVYKQSTVQPPTQARMTSPFDCPVSQPSIRGARSPPQYSDHREISVSPAGRGAVLSLGEVLSPVSPFPQGQPNLLSRLNPMIEQMTGQVQSFRQSLPVAPQPEVGIAPAFEIAHPTPRSHRHNLSEALQREIDEAERTIEEMDRNANIEESTSVEKPHNAAQPAEHFSHEEDGEEELPITQHPHASENGSEIETNPSLAASPLPTRKGNPSRNWQERPSLPNKNSSVLGTKGHAAQPSTSKLNVEAMPFDPKGAFSSSTFAFGGTTFNPFGLNQSTNMPSFSSSLPLPESRSLAPAPALQFNVTAPAFTPLAAPPRPTESSRASSFTFSSASFNVEAPEFNPSHSLGGSATLPMLGPSVPTSKIFGEVIIDSARKATRRSSKAVPITRPFSKEGPTSDQDGDDSEESLPSEDDDEGRPQAPLERQKRTKRVDSDGDRSPVFAASAPFLQGNKKAQIGDDPFLDHGILNSDSLDTLVKTFEPRPVTAQSDTGSAAMEESSPYTFRGEADAANFSAATPLTFPDQGAHAEKSPSPSRKKELPESGHPDSEGPHDANARGQMSPNSQAPRWAATSSDASPPLLQPGESPEHRYTVQGRTDAGEPLVSYIGADSNEGDSPRFSEEGAFENGHTLENIEDTDHSDREHVGDSADEPVPSYEEIDAVMRQFEDNPDLGVERLDTPPVQPAPSTDLQLQPSLRSDAPSPSPRRVEPHKPEVHGEKYSWRPPKQSQGIEISVHKLTNGNEPVSDWNDAMSPVKIDRLENRAQYFDGHVYDLVAGIMEDRLGPMEKTLMTIQQSIALLATQPKNDSGRRSVSIDLKSKDSDADDEDEDDALEGLEAYRSRSPITRRTRKPDRVRAAVMEALTAHQIPIQEQTRKELDSVHVALAELKEMAEQSRNTPSNDPEALKVVVEEVIGTHPRLRGHRVKQSHGGDDSKRMLQVDGLETMLKVAEERAEHEARSRRQVEDELADALRRLRYAEEDVALHKESSQEAERSLSAFIQEKEAYHDLEDEIQNLKWKNAALETTLEEYRVSSDKWRDDIQEERTANRDLHRTLEDVRNQLENRSQSRQALRIKVEQLQQAMADVTRDVASDQAEWRKQEHALISKHVATQAALNHEMRHREKIEMELEELDREHKENIKYRAACGVAEQDVSSLQALVSTLQSDNKSHQDRAFMLERELTHVKETAQTTLSESATVVQGELKQARAEAVNMRTDFEAQIIRLKSRVDNAELDLEEQKAKHEQVLAENVDTHTQAMQEARDEREAVLQGLHSTYDRKLADLRDRHTRAMHNSSDDRHRLEHHLNEKLSLSDDKVQHLESKVVDLQERLEITRSAAKAAVEAATSKGINLPTPAPSTVASPPQAPAAARSASIAFIPGSDVPEKISPQALRESIIVLQDQLQNREQTIEKLQSELAAIEKNAAKTKDHETEVGWLRELLSVRVGDLEEIVNTLNKPDFDREAAKDAAIRLKANLQMEQQLKERAAAGMTIQLPSMASLQSLTQSPRALPMAAVAALGNWRKARDSSFGALSDLASNLGQTPTKSSSGSPASFLAGMMTPPSTSAKVPTPPTAVRSPPSMRPLAHVARKSSTEARPLRAYTSQPRALSSRQQDSRPASQLQIYPPVPFTPPLMTQSSYDADADVKSLTGDLDSDASPLDGKENKPFAMSAE